MAWPHDRQSRLGCRVAACEPMARCLDFSQSLRGEINLLDYYRCFWLAQDYSERSDMFEKILRPRPVERKHQQHDGACERPPTLPGVPLAPIAGVDDGAVDDLCPRKVLMHFFDSRPKHRIDRVRTVGKALRPAD